MGEPNLVAAERRRSAAIAGHQGDLAMLRTMADDPDASVRAVILGALARAGDLLSADLTTALADPSPVVRRRALEVIAAIHGTGPAADISLLPLLEDPDDTVIETAAWACGEREPVEEGAVTALCTLVTDAQDSLVREAAVAALGAIGDPAGLPAILAATSDKATVRRRAVIALAPFDGPEVDDAYQRALTDRDWQVRQAAEDLAEVDDPGPGAHT